MGEVEDKGGAVKPVKARVSPVRPRESNLGQTLRAVYQQTVNEDVPDEMLDLLGKLS